MGGNTTEGRQLQAGGCRWPGVKVRGLCVYEWGLALPSTATSSGPHPWSSCGWSRAGWPGSQRGAWGTRQFWEQDFVRSTQLTTRCCSQDHPEQTRTRQGCEDGRDGSESRAHGVRGLLPAAKRLWVSPVDQTCCKHSYQIDSFPLRTAERKAMISNKPLENTVGLKSIQV